MPTTKHLLSFVTDASGAFVSIHADLSGVEYLIEQLQRIRAQLLEDECPHAHLFSPECAGDGLTTTKLPNQPDEDNIVHHVKIYGWNGEWARRHCLKA